MKANSLHVKIRKKAYRIFNTKAHIISLHYNNEERIHRQQGHKLEDPKTITTTPSNQTATNKTKTLFLHPPVDKLHEGIFLVRL